MGIATVRIRFGLRRISWTPGSSSKRAAAWSSWDRAASHGEFVLTPAPSTGFAGIGSSLVLPLRIDVRDPVRGCRRSRLSAKVDSAAVQDGFQLYHHTFLFTPDGTWAVVQQGMNEATGRARRYHWLTPPRFDADPHAAVAGAQGQGVLNGSIACCSRPTRRSPRTNTGLLAVRG